MFHVKGVKGLQVTGNAPPISIIIDLLKNLIGSNLLLLKITRIEKYRTMLTINSTLVLGIILMNGQLHLLMDTPKVCCHFFCLTTIMTDTSNRGQVQHPGRVPAIDNLKWVQACGSVL